MPEIAQIETSQIGPYIQTMVTISELFFLPFMVFSIYLTFALHLSTLYPTSTNKINTVISARKKSTMLILIFFRLYQQCFYYFYSSYTTPEGLILSLLSELMIQMALIVSTTFITVQNTKAVSLPFKHLIASMLTLIVIDYVLKIYIEVYYDVFLLLITFSPLATCITFYLTVLFFRYPTNEYVRLFSSNIAYVELQELLNANLATKTFNEQRNIYSNTKTVKGAYNMLNQSIGNNNKLNTNVNKKSNNAMTNCLSIHQKKTPLKRVINDLPTINISFKMSFHINYYEDKGTKSIDSLYTNIAFDFTVRIIELSLENKVKRTLNEFAQLEQSLYEEINEENFSKYLVDKIPSLNIHITTLSTFTELISNSDAMTLIKKNIEHFIQGIINEPALITRSVLEFINIIDNKDLEEFYTAYRRKYLISDSIKLNVYNNLSRIISHQPDRLISKVMNFSVIESIPNKLFEKEYTLTIRVKCENSFKIVKKGFSDTLLMLNEANQVRKDVKELKDIVSLSSMMKSRNQLRAYDKFRNASQVNKSMIEFVSQLEAALMFISNNYPKYKSNIIIAEYYSDFFSSFNFLSSPIKHQASNSSKSLEADSQDKFEALLNENMISYIDIIAKNFLFISIDFKIKVFYEIAFKIISRSQDQIVLDKRYKFKEIKHYIDVMNTSLGLTNLITLPIALSSAYSNMQDLNVKSKERLAYLQKALNAITNHKFFLRITYWKELIYLDIAFSLIQSNAQKQRIKSNKDMRVNSTISGISMRSASASPISSSRSSLMMNDSFYNSLVN